MPLAISYLRFSSAPQQYGDSLRRQQEAVGRWLQQNPSYQLSDVKYEDLGVSAWSGAHKQEGALGQLLEAVEQGIIPAGSAILVEALDRFSRLPFLDTLNLLSGVLSKGVDLITLEDGLKYDKGSLQDLSKIYLLVGKTQAANEYSNRLSTRIAESYIGRANKAKEGESIKRRNPFWLTSDGKLKADEAKVVKEIFQSYVNGIGVRELARQYNHIFANPSSVKKLLTNTAVIGHWQRYRVDRDTKQRVALELIKNAFEPAIDEVLFYQAQNMMNKQPGMTHPRSNHLAGIVVCKHCGGNFATRRANEKSITASMGCYARMLNKESCTNSKNIPMPVLEAVYEATIQSHLYSAMQKTQLSDVAKERIVVESRIDSVKQQQRSLLTLLASMDDEVLQERYKALVDELEVLNLQLTALPDNSEQVVVDMGKYMEWVVTSGPIAVSKTLQMSGYRIVCNVDGGMGVYGDEFKYLGYRRGAKEFEILTPNGEVKNTANLYEWLIGNGSKTKYKMDKKTKDFMSQYINHFINDEATPEGQKEIARKMVEKFK